MSTSKKFFESKLLNINNVPMDQLLNEYGPFATAEGFVMKQVDLPSRSIAGSNGS